MGTSQSTLLDDAIRYNDVQKIKEIIENDKKKNTSVSTDALLFLIDNKNEEKILLLLNCGVDPNKVGNFYISIAGYSIKTTPIHFSLKYQIQYMKLLLEHGANPNLIFFDQKDNTEEAPLHTLCSGYRLQDDDQLIEKINLLISKGANVNLMTRCYPKKLLLTPLMVAINSFYINQKTVEIVNIFLKNGYDLNLKFDSKPIDIFISEIIAKNEKNDPRNPFLTQILSNIQTKKSNSDGRRSRPKVKKMKKNGKSPKTKVKRKSSKSRK